MNFTDSIRICLKEKYANFSGRASRSEFWYFALFALIVYIISIVLVFSVSFSFIYLFSVFIFAMILPTLAVTVRRLHDINKSGWFILLPFPFEVAELLLEESAGEPSLLSLIFTIIVIGTSIYLLVLYYIHGDKKDNRFGKNIYKKVKKRK